MAEGTPPAHLDPPPPHPSPAPPTWLTGRARELGVEFDEGDLDRLAAFLALLLDTSRTMNLTAIRDPGEAWERHILDALSIIPLILSLSPRAEEEPLRVVDVGSGGGLPGIPLAICLPQCRFTLLEATRKKAAFLERAIRTLALPNASVLSERAERAGRWATRDSPTHRDSFDLAIARAVGHVAIVAELCLPLVRPGGMVVLVKGEKALRELAEAALALRTLGGEHLDTVRTPTGRLVILEKTRPTPRDYPRREGEPARRPLGIHP